MVSPSQRAAPASTTTATATTDTDTTAPAVDGLSISEGSTHRHPGPALLWVPRPHILPTSGGRGWRNAPSVAAGLAHEKRPFSAKLSRKEFEYQQVTNRSRRYVSRIRQRETSKFGYFQTNRWGRKKCLKTSFSAIGQTEGYNNKRKADVRTNRFTRLASSSEASASNKD